MNQKQSAAPASQPMKNDQCTSLSPAPTSPAFAVHSGNVLPHPQYRPDIDGLRAIAVLSVVGFHAFPSTFRGGFVGVDIFFVISGFLISTILLQGLEQNRFSLLEFYYRRIRRIFPALIVVLAATFLLGWFVLLTDEYKQVGKHIAGGAAFISNLVLWSESGYFDKAAETKPLLHLWSLGIEEQFYILWPLLLWLSTKIRLPIPLLLSTLAALSFFINITEIRTHAVATFYSPQTRFWELLLGCLLASFSVHHGTAVSNYGRTLSLEPSTAKFPFRSSAALNSFQSLLGASLIAAGIGLTTRELPFPGWWALLPTSGAVLVIAAGSRAWLNRIVLSNSLLVWFGLVSFPLYLWHWPLLSYARILGNQTPSSTVRMGASLAALALAWLTYTLIERPIRRGSVRRANEVTLIVLMVATGLTGFLIYKNDGLGFRLADRREYSEYFENSRPEMKYFGKINIVVNFRDECDFFDFDKYKYGQQTDVPRKQIARKCYERSSQFENALFIWGDSHAQQLYSGLRNRLPGNWQILQVASSGCAPDLRADNPSTTNQCEHSNWFALRTIRQTRPDLVIVAQDKGHDLDTMNGIHQYLTSLGVARVLFIGPTPHWTDDLPNIIAKKLWINTPQRTYTGINQDVLEVNKRLNGGFQPSESKIFVNLIDLFCDRDGCLTYLGGDKKSGITSWDYGHLTPIASDYIAVHLLVNLITRGHTGESAGDTSEHP